MYKIEIHLHTAHSSSCGKVDADTIARLYAAAGYSGIVVTDHFSRKNFDKHGWKISGTSLPQFLDGYHRLTEAAKPYGIKVYRGAEIRFDGSPNDFLLYNYPDELLSDPNDIFTMGVEKFHELSRQAGALLIQAHPFRDQCSPVDHRAIDGVELYNFHPRHDPHTDKVLSFANAHPGLIRTSGSDFHQLQDAARGGILTECVPRDEVQLAQILKSGAFELIKTDC